MDQNWGEPEHDYYPTLMLFRRIELSIGVLVILGMIIDICRRRLYVYNTLRLYMFMCACYILGMGVILLHGDWITNGAHRMDMQDSSDLFIVKILSRMKTNHTAIWCGLEAFFNLYFYCLGYFFAVLITYHVRCVINNSYRNFMRNVLKRKKVLVFLLLMLVFHLAPFVLMFVYSYQKESNGKYDYYFSYGPTGFPYDKQNWLLFCGQSFNPEYPWTFWVLLAEIYSFPVFLLGFHMILACAVRNETQSFLNDEYLNSKQNFIIRSGNIGYIILFIQLVNALKEIIITSVRNETVGIILNFAFDLYPFILLYFYARYTKAKKGLRAGNNTLISEEVVTEK